MEIYSLLYRYIKIAGMARGPLATAMVGKTIGRKINEGKVPVYISRFADITKEASDVSGIPYIMDVDSAIFALRKNRCKPY